MRDVWRAALGVFENGALRSGCSDDGVAAAASELDVEFPVDLVAPAQ